MGAGCETCVDFKTIYASTLALTHLQQNHLQTFTVCIDSWYEVGKRTDAVALRVKRRLFFYKSTLNHVISNIASVFAGHKTQGIEHGARVCQHGWAAAYHDAISGWVQCR